MSMNGATTLDGYFYEDDDQNLVQRIEQAIANGRLKEPSRVLVSWQEMGTGTFPTLLKKDVAPMQLAGVRPLCEELKAEIERQKGKEPSGTLKIRVYESGRSSDNAVDFTRQIRPAGVDGSGTVPSLESMVNRLLARCAHLEQVNVEKDAQIAANSAIVGNIAAEQAKTIATLATQRSVATTAGDMGGLQTIIGLMVLAFSWPVIRSAFNLPKNASVNDLLRMAQENTAAFMSRATGMLDRKAPAAGQAEPATQAEAGAAPQPDAGKLADAPPIPHPDPELVIQLALKNADYREKLRAGIQQHWEELSE